MQRALKSGEPGTTAFIEENDANYTPATDYTDERHLEPIAIERLIANLDEIFPENQKLKTTFLKERATCKPYRGCYGTYPIGCSFCTGLKHEETTCPARTSVGKRNRSSGSSDNQEVAAKQAKN